MKKFQPGDNRIDIKICFSMLRCIDVAMAAFKVAAGKNVKKYVDGVFGKGNGFHENSLQGSLWERHELAVVVYSHLFHVCLGPDEFIIGGSQTY